MDLTTCIKEMGAAIEAYTERHGEEPNTVRSKKAERARSGTSKSAAFAFSVLYKACALLQAVKNKIHTILRRGSLRVTRHQILCSVSQKPKLICGYLQGVWRNDAENLSLMTVRDRLPLAAMTARLMARIEAWVLRDGFVSGSYGYKSGFGMMPNGHVEWFSGLAVKLLDGEGLRWAVAREHVISAE